ncbi:class I mannose-6-phosphate isomerase [Gloeocapsopsis crepidinum LEGE 06123]|uniref:Class I mannose-6-phosphate isomerase n=1 Tax=Gloeocapsopsis crepidinum LEGE 06123 TaxID=588587 RepID=A0ABR9UL28_9CHRO|nr:type I phosphomannose isomerase catalytic subunit [Gloeocapsopsis crepidinum]MBE9188991.1 class I mannose-6-phosphate isomerase [Gloeocapsopsis crepidinum LEGE 06123]
MNWYPIKLTTHIRKYAFGERAIADKLGKQGLPTEGIIAETWEISDYQDTTGTIVNGAFAGRTLHDLVLEYPNELVGSGWRGPHFPILEKFLDASHMLPVHLHADDEIAKRVYNEPNGKTEAWHIVWAALGATVLAGLKADFSRKQLFDAFVAQDYDSVMVRHLIQTGDTVYVPAGIIHSFGPDALVFEVQQTSDLGNSVMPTDLYGKPLSQEKWYENINTVLDELRSHYQPYPNSGLEIQQGANRRIFCCAGPYFALERLLLSEPFTEPSHPHRCITLTNVGDPVQLEFAEGTETLERAESCILPASIGEVRIIPDKSATLIAGYVPDLQHDVIAALRAAGYEEEQIQGLGDVDMS